MDFISNLNGLWAIEETAGQQIAAMLLALDGPTMVAAMQADTDGKTSTYDVNDGVAQISVNGPLMKQSDWFSRYMGASSSADIAAQLRTAAADPNVKAIMLSIDSPGGQVAGIEDAGAAVIAAKARKPVYGHVTDGCCSAAYWIGSQCDALYANQTAPVGSIGVYSRLYDMSGLYEKSGVKVHIFRSGEHKGAGTPGLPITDAQASEFQRGIDAVADVFKSAVRTGRKMKASQVDAIADGRVWMGDSAVKQGLIDGVASHDAVLSALKDYKPGRRAIKVAADSGTEGTDMSKSIVDKWAQIRALVMGETEAADTQDDPNADAAKTAEDTRVAELTAQLAAKDAEIASAKAQADASAKAQAEADAQTKATAAAAAEAARLATENAPHIAAVEAYKAAGKLTPAQAAHAVTLRKADPAAFDALMADKADNPLTPGYKPVKAEDVAQAQADGGDDQFTKVLAGKVRANFGKE